MPVFSGLAKAAQVAGREVGDCGWNDESSKTDSDRWSHGNEPDFDPRLVRNRERTPLIDLSNRKLPI